MLSENFCCQELTDAILENHTFFYDKKRLLYYVREYRNKNSWYNLKYCPFCGRKFSDDLSDEYFEIIRDPISGKIKNPLPDEFKSDIWWKKRHLDDPKVLAEYRKRVSWFGFDQCINS